MQIGGIGQVPPSWSVVGTADFNGDRNGDILWRESGGDMAIWLMNGLQVEQSVVLGQVAAALSQREISTATARGDVLWRDNNGNLAIWFMNGLQISTIGSLDMVPNNWLIAETGDFDGDGKRDILWRDTTSGAVAIWFMNGTQITQSAGLGII